MSTVPGASGTSAAPRAMVQLDEADQEEVQRAARTLLAHPLVTETWPDDGALRLVRRWSGVLTHEINRVLGYRLDVGARCARLYRRSATLSPHRPATVATTPPRALGRWGCAYLCLALAAMEGLGDQTTLSVLADEVVRLRAGDEALPVDLIRYDQRKALVDALRWLEERGVVTLRDGRADRWLTDEEGDALYDLDRDAASRLLAASPSVLRDVEDAGDFLVDTYPPTPEGDQARLRHRLARRLVEQPVVLYADLAPDELEHVRHRRRRISDAVEVLTGAQIEVRAEGLCLVDPPAAPMSAELFPGRGSEAHAALLWGTELVARTAGLAAPDGDSREGEGLVPAADADAAWGRVVTAYGGRFRADYRADPAKLRAAATAVLERFALAIAQPDGSMVVRPVLARFRPAVTVTGSQLSLLEEPAP